MNAAQEKVIRVFPRRTNGTPIDKDVRIGYPTLFDEADRIQISVAFTWDIAKAEKMAEAWKYVGPTEMGGPALGMMGEEFVPGRYLKKGYTITSRGCPNSCWFCSVWKRDGDIRELPITEGYNIQDDNILACSEHHIRRVFAMLMGQKNPIDFTGGWEATRVKDWHIELLTRINLGQVFFSYDKPEDYDSLYVVSKKLTAAGIIKNKCHKARCYVLIGIDDTMERADLRLNKVLQLGFMPMAMLWRNEDGKVDDKWKRFQRLWANPIIIGAKMGLQAV